MKNILIIFIKSQDSELVSVWTLAWEVKQNEECSVKFVHENFKRGNPKCKFSDSTGKLRNFNYQKIIKFLIFKSQKTVEVFFWSMKGIKKEIGQFLYYLRVTVTSKANYGT